MAADPDGDLALLTGPDVTDLLQAALATAGGRLLSWSARAVDHRPAHSTTVSYAARVAWADGERAETLGASTGLGTLDECPPGVIAVSDGERQVAVWRFPLDPALPALAAAHDPQAVSGLFASVGLPAGGLRGLAGIGGLGQLARRSGGLGQLARRSGGLGQLARRSGGLDSPNSGSSADSANGRLAGDDRVGTAAAVSRSAFQPGVPVAFVATGGSFADALSAGPAAARLGGPILLAGDDVPAATAEELGRLQPQRIVIVGGAAAVGTAAEEQLRAYSGTVERWAGADRFATSALVSNRVFEAGSPVYVATGSSFPDALAGGAAAGAANGPVLLVGDDVPAVIAEELGRLSAPSVTVLGGTQAVSDDVQAALGDNAVRVAGADRFETAARVAGTAFPDGAPTVYVATGAEFADALAGVPAATTAGGPILLVGSDHVPASTAAALEQLAPGRVVVLGGTAAVGDEVVTQLGADRSATQ